MSFTAELDQIAQRIKADNERLFRAVGIELFNRVISKTPVDTGRLRGNWQASTGRPASGTLENTSENMARDGANRTAAKLELNDTAYLTNNLPYAVTIEEGSSTQAPEGMVKTSLGEMEQVVRSLIRKK